MKNFYPIEEVGIKYQKIKLDKDKFVLIPVAPVTGYDTGVDFCSRSKLKTARSKEAILESKYLIDSIISAADLELKYLTDDEVTDDEDFETVIENYDEDFEFLIEYYFEEEINNLILIEIKEDKILKRKITIPEIKDLLGQEVYERQKSIPSVILNDSSLNELLEIEDIKELKEKLTRYKNLIERFQEYEESSYLTRIEVTDSHITSVESNMPLADSFDEDLELLEEQEVKKTKVIEDKPVIGDFSVKGLETYISERVFGHDKEIRTIAKTLYMNYTALGDERIASLLVVGPTGTGKTETFRIASKYLSIPFKEVNTVNLVPQGIVGTSLEDCLFSLIVQSGYDIKKASRGIVVLDEFDKLGNTQSDYKGDIKEILLKFVEGTSFEFEKEKKNYSLDTTRITKICAGAFTRIFEKDKGIGFGSSIRDYGRDIRPEEVKDRINEKGYFGIELLDRIEVPIVYHDLDIETKKRILLESKISEYLSKKQRYQRQFGVELEADDSYVEAIFESLNNKRESVRILNNLVHTTLDDAEYELCTNPNVRGKRLILTRKTVENPQDFTLL